MKSKPLVVIGAGVAGITAAIHLAKHGHKVLVIEKNARPGGRCDRIVHDGHAFDTGPTLLVMPLLYEAEFAALGVPLREMLELQRVDPTYHLVFDDGSQLPLTSDLQSMYGLLEAIEPGSYQGFLSYLTEGERHYRLGVPAMVQRDFRRWTDFFNLANVPLLYQVKPLANHYRHMAQFFTNPRLKAAFTFQDVYMGLSPYEAPATFSMMPYSELAHGVWYPKGGMYEIVEALGLLARQAGVEFNLNSPVDKINIQDNRAVGVRVEGQDVPAEAVLANADLPYVYQELLPREPRAARLLRKRYSCSVISFFWALDKPYPSLPPHTLFLADDYRANFDAIMDRLTLPDNPSLYVHAPTRLEASLAPAGQDNLIVHVPVGHLSEGDDQDWEARRDQARRQVFRRLALLGITDLEAHIKYETSFTPLSWKRRYNLVKGATHGLCHNLLQLGYLRPDFQHPRYRNLYFTGASTRPGTGLPTAMISGRQVAQRMLATLT